MRLRDFKVLSFDCYGTLIDWESGILAALRPLLGRVPGVMQPDAVLAAFAEHEVRQQGLTPAMKYRELLAVVHGQLAAAWGVTADVAESARFGASIGDWPPFPDTVAALQALRQRHTLAILSNVDRDSFRATHDRLGVAFDFIFTAQDIGSYKPDPRNFHYLLARLAEHGFAADQVLHVAQSLFHDHAPANRIGLHSAWIDRRHDRGGLGATAAPPAGVRYDWRFTSLAELAAA